MLFQKILNPLSRKVFLIFETYSIRKFQWTLFRSLLPSRNATLSSVVSPRSHWVHWCNPKSWKGKCHNLSFLLCFPIMEQLTLVPHTWILLIKALTVKFMMSLSPLIQAWQRGQIQGHMLLLCLEIISSRPCRTWTQTDLSSPFRNETELMKNGCKCLVMVPFIFSGALFVWFLNFVLFLFCCCCCSKQNTNHVSPVQISLG